MATLTVQEATSGYRRPDRSAWDLDDNTVQVWRVSLDDWVTRLNELTPTLSAEEGRRAGRYRRERDRADFVIGRGVLRGLLGCYLGVPPRELGFAYGRHGKPGLAAGVDPRLRFNVSHSGRLLVCAVARGREVGIDVECVRPLPDLEQVAACVFCPRERAVLRGLSGPEKEQTFYRCWTRKEAYIKADGDGFALPVDRIEVTLAPGDPAELLRGVGGEETCRWYIHDLIPTAGYAGSLATEGPVGSMRFWHLGPDRSWSADRADFGR